MKEISINMTTVEVKAQTRALKLNWTREIDKELEINHSFNIDDFNREILRSLRRERRLNSIKKIFFN